jgi:hypothetical protein
MTAKSARTTTTRVMLLPDFIDSSQHQDTESERFYVGNAPPASTG